MEEPFWQKIKSLWWYLTDRLSQTKSIWQRNPVTLIEGLKAIPCADCGGFLVDIDIVQRGLLDQDAVKERFGHYHGEPRSAVEYICLECGEVLVIS